DHNNTYTGPTVLQGNVILTVTQAQALGSASTSLTTINAGSTLKAKSGIQFTGKLILNGTGESGNGAIQTVALPTNATSAVTWLAPYSITLGSNASIGSDNLSSFVPLIIQGPIIDDGVQNPGKFDLRKVTTNVLTLPNASPALLGNVFVDAGIVNIQN